MAVDAVCVDDLLRSPLGPAFGCSLPVRTYRTDVIGEHGNVVRIVDSVVDLDRPIGAELSRMRWCVDASQDL